MPAIDLNIVMISVVRATTVKICTQPHKSIKKTLPLSCRRQQEHLLVIVNAHGGIIIAKKKVMVNRVELGCDDCFAVRALV